MPALLPTLHYTADFCRCIEGVSSRWGLRQLAAAVRKARTDGNIHKYYVDQNGIIKIRKTADKNDKYIKVKSFDHLNNIINS